MYTTSEAPPRIAKSMGASHGPCGLLSASSRRDSRSAGRPPPSAAPNRATKAAVVVPPIVAGQAVEPPVWERTKRTLPSPGNLAQVSISQRPRGASPRTGAGDRQEGSKMLALPGPGRARIKHGRLERQSLLGTAVRIQWRRRANSPPPLPQPCDTRALSCSARTTAPAVQKAALTCSRRDCTHRRAHEQPESGQRQHRGRGN